MGRGRDRLRITTLGVGAASTALAGVAGAAPTALPIAFTTAGAAWTSVSNSTSGPFSNADALGITDASLTGPNMSDAFDGALIATVNGKPFQDPDGVVDLSARTLTSVGDIGQFRVIVEYQFFPSRAAVRSVFTVRNIGNATRNVSLGVGTNYGSDSSTVLESTSDGNTNLDEDDRWFVTSDEVPLSDPAIITARGNRPGPLASAPGGNDGSFNGNDNWVEARSLRLAPNEAKSVMFFHELTGTVAAAVARGKHYATAKRLDKKDLLIGLNRAERARIVNWRKLV